MDSIELEIVNIDNKITKYVDEKRYAFLRFKKADKLVIAIKNKIVLGNVAIYYKGFNGKNIAMIGIIHCPDKEGALSLLEGAVQELQRIGHFKIVAPIDRDTWSDYRVKESSLLEKPFYGEPSNFPWMCEVFKESGFSVGYRYISTLDPLIKKDVPSIEGLNIRRLEEIDLEQELNRIYDISIEAFCDNVFYGNIEREIFINNYKKMYEALKPDVLIAEYNGEEVGFLIGYGSEDCKKEGKTYVFKTIAVKKDFRKLKIGGAMVSTLGNLVYDLGYKFIIGGLIYSENVSYKLTKKYGGMIVSEYSLYQKMV